MNPAGPGLPVFFVGGTRPEAVKLAPVVLAVARAGQLRPVVVATGQHPTMFHQGLDAFGLRPDRELTLVREHGNQAELVAQLCQRLDAELVADQPAAVVVQGDTSSALVGALTAFWRQVPVAHLEAGLRTHDLTAPFPEEGNRRMIGQIAAAHLAPTPAAAANLAAEGVPFERIDVVGNTVVDAVLTLAGRLRGFAEPALAAVDAAVTAGRRLVLVTVHRRESWGEPLRSVLRAVGDILDAHRDTFVVLPVHPNPAVRREVMAALGADARVLITEPLGYPDLIRLLELSSLVLSDSGGIQEEAPCFGVPVLVLRDRTERQEAIDAGCAWLVGTDRRRIAAAADGLLTSGGGAPGLGERNPFGDGRAGDRAAALLAKLAGLPVRTLPPFVPAALSPLVEPVR